MSQIPTGPNTGISGANNAQLLSYTNGTVTATATVSAIGSTYQAVKNENYTVSAVATAYASPVILGYIFDPEGTWTVE